MKTDKTPTTEKRQHAPEDIQRLLQTAVNAAVRAGREVMDVYRREYTVTEKDDNSPLTEADTRSDREILRVLKTDTPDVAVLSEEGAHLPWEERRRWTRFWLVDPLDGTKEFIKHNDEFTVNVALMVGAEHGGGLLGDAVAATAAPLLGVVYLPALRTLYAGIVGVGAWRIIHDPADAPPAVTVLRKDGTALPDPVLRADRPLTIVASRSHMSPATELFVQDRRREHPDLALVSSGSSLKICRVAEGSADEYPRFAPTMEWDTAAGDAVARAAGCEVLRWRDRDDDGADSNESTVAGPRGPLEYNKEDLHNPWFLVRRETTYT